MIADFRFKNRKLQNGFTLIEVLIYIAIIGMVTSSFIVFSISVSNSRSKTYVVQEVQANMRTAVNIISQKLRASNGVNIGVSTLGVDPGFLSLSMASSTLSPTIIGLNQDNGILGIKEGTSATTSITSDEVKVTNLVFTDVTGPSARENIRVEITIEFNNIGTDVEYNYTQNLQTAVSLRQ